MSSAAALLGFLTLAIVNPREPTFYHVNAQINNKALAPAPLIWKSQAIATAIFAKIGIQLTWRFDGRRPASKMVRSCGGESHATDLAVEINSQAPASLSHTALALSIPLSDSLGHIAIFYDRVVPVLREHPSRQAAILGYVLAHEIAHVLQGVARHSETGIMRACWTENDFSQMGSGVLSFTAEDVELIQRRLERVASTSCNYTSRSILLPEGGSRRPALPAIRHAAQR